MTSLLLALPLLLSADLKHFENFAQNPSFEEDRDRDGMPDSWSGSAYDSPAQLAWDASVAHSGTRSLSIRDSAAAGTERDWKKHTGRYTSEKRPVQPGAKYELEVWVKTQDVTGEAYAHLAWQKGSKWLSEVSTERLSGTGDWQRLQVSAVAPDEADTVVISMNLARSKGQAWFDDIRVTGPSEMPPEATYVYNDTQDWFPFVFPFDDTNLDTIDLTGLLDAPAGKHGFVGVREDGHFYFEDGTRARFFGTNVGGADCAPPKEKAPALAARLAKYGVNILRLHSFDSQYGPLIDYRTGTTRELNADGLDRLDYFIAELKRRGIYVYIDLLDYRQFRTADGVKHGDEFTHNWAGSMKGASIFDERMIELQKEYATKLLTHLNPYTGLRYVDEPAIAVVETTNENSVFYFVRQDGLSHEYYRDELMRRWNRWLAGRYGDRAGLAKAWALDGGGSALAATEDPAQGTVEFPFGMLGRIRTTKQGQPDAKLALPRTSDALRFVAEIQRNYYQQMHSHLKQLGVRVPIAGTNQTFLPLDTSIDAELNDFMSRNQYWRHPNRNAKPYSKFSNEPMLRVDIPTERNPLSVIARTSVVGKPQAVAEYNFPWPNEYRCEGLLMSVAYACLQDWDLFLLFSYKPGEPKLGMFASQSDPARWGEFPAAALMFHRHDVARGKNEIHVVHDVAHLYQPEPDTRYAKYTNHRYLTFLSKVRTGFADGAYTREADAVLACAPSNDLKVSGSTPVVRFAQEPWDEWLYPEFVSACRKLQLSGYEQMEVDAKRFDSDTGELSLDYGKGMLRIDTPRTQGVIGYVADAGAVDLGAISVKAATPFAAIVASSLDGEPLGQSRRVVLTAVGRAENTAQAYWPPTPEEARRSEMSWMLPGAGRTPVIAEPIQAVVTLAMPAKPMVYALDPSGKRSRQLEVQFKGRRAVFDLASAQSIWCEVVVE
ncbi:MAG: hypothetical protein ACOY3P_19560 [Planctomycetota bacterium]